MRICFFGDSFVNGTGDPIYQGWVGRICERARARGHDITAYNCGVRRATSGDIRAHWHREASWRLPPEHPGALVFSFGANDRVIEMGQTRMAESDQYDNLRTILMEAMRHWPTLFISSPRALAADAGGHGAAQAGAFGAICAELGVPFFDGFTASQDFVLWPKEARAGDAHIRVPAVTRNLPPVSTHGPRGATS